MSDRKTSADRREAAEARQEAEQAIRDRALAANPGRRAGRRATARDLRRLGDTAVGMVRRPPPEVAETWARQSGPAIDSEIPGQLAIDLEPDG
jgi:hypothetical protein